MSVISSGALTRLLAGLAAAAFLAAAAPAAAGAAPPPESVAGELVVGLRGGAGAAARADVARRAGVHLARRLSTRGAWLARVRPGVGRDEALERLRAERAVRWAEPNYLYRQLLVPDDPVFPSQWGLRNTGLVPGGVPGADIDAPAAWDRTTGSAAVKVAVVDTGMDYAHPDLAPNVGIVNPGEAGDGRETNGIDDDGNRLVDDWRGWDFANLPDDADPQDQSPSRHGSVVAGVLGARGGDGFGVAGVSWSSRLIPVRALNADGSGTSANLAFGITYAASLGARILNASFGGPRSNLIEDAIRASPNTLVVTAAGNQGGDNDAFGLRGTPTFPCNLTLDNVVCVAATDQADELATFSNVGLRSVDLAAPGVAIIGPGPSAGTNALSGTSFSAPHVSGVAALVLAENPGASTRQVRGALLAGVEALPALDGTVATGGRLDALTALDNVPAPGDGPGGASGPAVDLTATGARLTGTLPAGSEPLAYYFEYGPTAAYGQVTPTRPAPPGDVREVAEVLDRLAPDSEHHARLVVAALGGITAGADVVFRTVVPTPGGGTPPPPGAAAGAGVSPPPPIAPSPPATTPPARAARPTASVARSGGEWFVSLRLGERSRVILIVRRRVGVHLRSVRTIRLTAAGQRRVSLGSLPTGRYRVTLRIQGETRSTELVRSPLVPPR